MNVAFRLKKSGSGHAALAALTPGRDAAALLSLCARLGLDPFGRVFQVEGGYLVTLDAPTRAPIPGAMRLRALATNLYLPADALLVPALLDDEAEGLARDRGLVFLPAGRVLAFDPKHPVDPTTLMKVKRAPKREWFPLPVPPALASRIEEIVVDLPDETPESVFDDGGNPIGIEEPPRPEEVGPSSKLLGQAAYGMGKGMAWLGNALNSSKLAALGSGWIEKATKLAPRLTEDLLGRQTAALRNLLKEFRDGHIDRALRSALPVGEPGDLRGATPFTGDRLPESDFRYGLNDMLSGATRGGSSGIWVGQGDVMAELVREYRKAAEEAIRKGDYRRAAAIYGKLLRDYRAAAQALLRGGLHHDAAVLLIAKLDDRRGAARAFESAGELDRAVQLYRQVGEHEQAGDLLRRIGEEDAALEEYRTAADRLTAGTLGHLGAGRLLLNKAGRPDLALAYFAAGWSRRPGPNAVGCALEAAKVLAEKGDIAGLTPLLDEADIHFESLENDSVAGQFYNGVVELADRPALSASREGLRDRVLLAIAAQMRRLARPGQNTIGLIPSLMGRSGAWPAPAVSDAAFALAAASRRPAVTPLAADDDDRRPVDRAARRFRVGMGIVTATTGAYESGTVFLGFEDGNVFAFRPELSEVVAVSIIGSTAVPVVAIATDPDGERVVVLNASETGSAFLRSFLRQPDGSYRILPGEGDASGPWQGMNKVFDPWLTNILPSSNVDGLFDGDSQVGLWNGNSLELRWAGSLNTWNHLRPTISEHPFATAILLESDADDRGTLRVLAHDGDEWCELRSPVSARNPDHIRPVGLRWRPILPAQSSLRSLPLSWAMLGDNLVIVAGLGEGGSLQSAYVQNGDLVGSCGMDVPEGFLAAGVVRDTLIAGVTRFRVLWLKPGSGRFNFWRETPIAIPRALAAFSSRKTGELIVVCKDGFVARVTIPS